MKLTTIVLAAVASCSGVQQEENYLNNEQEFLAGDNFEHLAGYTPVSFEKGSKQPTAIMAFYDYDRDGQSEVSAFYKIKGFSFQTNKYESSDKASVIIVYDTINKKIDYVLFDTDNNGSLETKKQYSEFLKGVKKI